MKPFFLLICRFIVLIVFFASAVAALRYSLIVSAFFYSLYCSFWNLWGWAGLGHELVHNSFFKQTKLNQFMLVVVSLLTLSNYQIFCLTHFEHHAHPHTESDLESPYRANLNHLPRNICLSKLINVQKLVVTFKYLLMNSFGVIPAGPILQRAKQRRRERAVAANSSLIICYVLSIVTLSIHFGTIAPIMLLIMPNFFCCNLYESLASLQHPTKEILNFYKIRIDSGCISPGHLNLLLRDSLDVRLPRLIELFYSYMNYHASHHYRMNTPCYRLQKLSSNLAASGSVVIGKPSIYGVFRLFLAG